MKIKFFISEKLTKSQGEDLLILKSSQHFATNLDLLMLEKMSLSDDRAFLTPLYQSGGYLCLSFCRKGKTVTAKALSMSGEIEGLRRGDEGVILSFKGIKIALVVDVDLFSSKLMREFKREGAELILARNHIFPKDYTHDFVDYSAFSACQGNNLYGIAVSNFAASVLAPCALTEDFSGYIIKEREGEFCFELDVKDVNAGTKSFPIFQSMNYELYEILGKSQKRGEK